MKLRRLNTTGVSQFADWLENVRTGGKDDPPTYLLEHDEYSEAIEQDIDVESPGFPTRYQLGVYLVDKLSDCEPRTLENDSGLWTWLALLLIDELCPVAQDGSRKPLRNDNYILSDRHRDYHRHAIRTTWLFVRAHGNTVKFIFSNPLSKRGELTEQLTASPYFLSCKGLIDAAQYLYDDPVRETWKRGAAGKGPGVARRLASILNQFMLTYDLHSMDRDAILSILPAKEFARFMVQGNAP